jgi:carbamoyl-phosphate synthase large subunit
MLGSSMSDLELSHKKIPHYGVKESIFPFNMFHEVDPILGPEMRSTGEVLGLADSFELAFHKAQEAAQQYLPQEGSVLISVSDSEKNEALEVAREFRELGFSIKATEGTHQFLSDNGVESEKILKMHAGRPNIVDGIKNGEINLVINTPIGKRSTHDDSYIRKTAIKHKIPYATTMAAAKAAAKGIAASRRKEGAIVSLQSYHAGIK